MFQLNFDLLVEKKKIKYEISLTTIGFRSPKITGILLERNDSPIKTASLAAMIVPRKTIRHRIPITLLPLTKRAGSVGNGEQPIRPGESSVPLRSTP